MAAEIRKAVIPAGGLGTRFLPVTKSVPKELLPIGTRPTIQIVLEEAVESGIEEVILITSPQKAHILDFFMQDTDYTRELNQRGKGELLDELHELLECVRVTEVIQDDPHGLGHAVLCAKDAVGDEPFVVMLPDVLISSLVPCCLQLMKAYNICGCSISATEHTPREKLSFYGIYDIARSEGRIHWARGVVEKPSPEEAPSDLSVVGRYLFSPEVFDDLAKTTMDARGEIQLADAMNALAARGRMAAFEYDGRQFDTGDPIGFLKANIYYSWQTAPLELAEFVHEMIGGNR